MEEPLDTNIIMVLVPQDSIDIWWGQLFPWIEDFCLYSQGSFDPPFILETIRSGFMQPWVVKKDEKIIAVWLTEIRKTAVKEFVMIVATGQEMKEWADFLPSLEKYAIANGCKKMVGVARPGWEKILKPSGYKKTHVQMEKFL